MRCWKIAIFVGMLAVAILPGTTPSAQTSTQCDGLTGYREAVLAAINEDGSLDDVNTLLAAITPPLWAKDWHQALIDRIDLQLQLQSGTASLTNKEEASDSPSEEIARSNTALHSAGDALASSCAEFGKFASEVDESLAGTLLLADTPMPLGIIVPVSGRAVGLDSAPLTVVEWGDYT